MNILKKKIFNYKNGVRKLVENYADGKLNGPRTEYDIKGNEISTTFWVDNEIIEDEMGEENE